MPENFKKEDLRTVKTKKAIFDALTALLKRRKFAKITVFDICNEALISRTAFYAHYYDKYDLLSRWLTERMRSFYKYASEHTPAETADNLFEILKINFNVVVNLLDDSDHQQHALIVKAVSSVPSGHADNENYSVIMSDFLAGGLLNIALNWIKNYRKSTENQTKETIVYVHKIIKNNL